MAQRYHHPEQHNRMRHGNCPECGQPPAAHLDDPRFWIPRSCDLMTHGVTERIDQYLADKEAGEAYASV